jgi:hypothetical protein
VGAHVRTASARSTLHGAQDPRAQIGAAAGGGRGTASADERVPAGLELCRHTRSEAADAEGRRRLGRANVRGERARGVGDEGAATAVGAGDAETAAVSKEVEREGAPDETSSTQTRMDWDFVRMSAAYDVGTGSSSVRREDDASCLRSCRRWHASQSADSVVAGWSGA